MVRGLFPNYFTPSEGLYQSGFWTHVRSFLPLLLADFKDLILSQGLVRARDVFIYSIWSLFINYPIYIWLLGIDSPLGLYFSLAINISLRIYPFLRFLLLDWIISCSICGFQVFERPQDSHFPGPHLNLLVHPGLGPYRILPVLIRFLPGKEPSPLLGLS